MTGAGFSSTLVKTKVEAKPSGSFFNKKIDSTPKW